MYANAGASCKDRLMSTSSGDSRRRRGLFITFEGGDGAGKTTQIEHVKEWFDQAGCVSFVTREPGGTDMGNQLRQLIQHGPEDVDPRTEALLYAADRAYHVATVIRPALAAGQVVLADRFIDSSVAYQGAARELGVDEVLALSKWATEDLSPDLTLLLDLPPEVGARRGTASHTADRIERESMDFHERVRHEYLHLADRYPDRIVVIDAVGTPEEVFREIRGVLEERVRPALGLLVNHEAHDQVELSATESPQPNAPAPEHAASQTSDEDQAGTMVAALLKESQGTLWEGDSEGLL